MNFLKKGPEIKLSELKIPDFVYDVYHDLKERHLLPLVVILLVALIAVPILLESSRHSSDQEPNATLPATAPGAAGGSEALVVARSEPGLREIRRRFKHYRALDPFAEKPALDDASGASSEEAAEAGEETGEPAPAATEEAPVEASLVGGEEASSPPVEPSVPVEAPVAPVEVPTSPAPESSGSDGGTTRTRYASDSIDVRIVAVPSKSQAGDGTEKGSKRKPKAEVRRNLPELTMLPDHATPAVAFMGVSPDGKKALFLVSSDVVSIFGEGSCMIGSQTCQLLALEPNLPETFVYGPQERTYRIELLKIDHTYSAKPGRASLGGAKHTKKRAAREPEGSDPTDPTKPAGRGEAAEAPAG
jgi:hypothetical protein